MVMRTTVLLLTTIVLFGVSSASAQDPTNLNRSRLNTAAYYNYSEQGDVTILVHVWGALRYPGLYEVPHGTRLSVLFSLAGGPQIGERSKRSKRTVDVKLVRVLGGERGVIYETSMENQIIVTNEDPVLQSGDVLSVESVIRQGISWRDVFPVVAAVASLALAIDRINNR